MFLTSCWKKFMIECVLTLSNITSSHNYLSKLFSMGVVSPNPNRSSYIPNPYLSNNLVYTLLFCSLLSLHELFNGKDSSNSFQICDLSRGVYSNNPILLNDCSIDFYVLTHNNVITSSILALMHGVIVL